MVQVVRFDIKLYIFYYTKTCWLVCWISVKIDIVGTNCTSVEYIHSGCLEIFTALRQVQGFLSYGGAGNM